MTGLQGSSRADLTQPLTLSQREVRPIAGQHGEVVQSSERDDLVIDGMVWIWHPQVTQKMGGLAIEGKNPVVPPHRSVAFRQAVLLSIQSAPDLIRAYLEDLPANASGYCFSAPELKEREYRLDGLFLTTVDGAAKPVQNFLEHRMQMFGRIALDDGSGFQAEKQ